MPINPKAKLVEKYKGKSAQDIQDDIFREMSADERLKLGSEFSMYCLKRGYTEGAPVSVRYLKQWLMKNQKTALLRFMGISE